MGGRRLQCLDTYESLLKQLGYTQTLKKESMIAMIAKEEKEVCHEWNLLRSSRLKSNWRHL